MSNFRSPIIWTVAAILVLSVIYVIALLVRNSRQKEWGFKDVVRNPEYWEQMVKSRRGSAEEIAKAQSWDDAQVTAAIDKFVLHTPSSSSAQTLRKSLQSLGPRTHAHLLTLLADPALRQKLVTPTGDNLGPEAPFNRACDVLDEDAPPEAISVLAPFLDDPSYRIRWDAAGVIAHIDSPSTIPYIRKALRDEEDSVRGAALHGLEDSMKRPAFTLEAKQTLYPEVLAMLQKSQNADNAARLLFQLDARRATEYFLSPEVFRPDSRILSHALVTLSGAKVSVPREKLLPLIAILDGQKLTYSQSRIFGTTLYLLSHHRLPDDLPLLQAKTTHENTDVAVSAAHSLLVFHGLEKFQDRINEVSDYSLLNKHQQYYDAVSMCEGEVYNGGFAQYFVNPSGDHWREAVAGLEAMKSRELLSILKDAAALFGPTGPSPDQTKRQVQLSKVYDKNEQAFDALDDRFYKSKEKTQILALAFVLTNPESFKE